MMAAELDAWVRPALASDADVLERHRRQSETEGLRYRGALVDLRLEDGDFVTLVAGFGATVMASLTARRDPDHGWVIGRVFVEESAREVGLGDALLGEFLGSTARSGEDRVLAQAQPGDRATKNLFERHGLVARTILVGKVVSGPSSAADASR